MAFHRNEDSKEETRRQRLEWGKGRKSAVVRSEHWWSHRTADWGMLPSLGARHTQPEELEEGKRIDINEERGCDEITQGKLHIREIPRYYHTLVYNNCI